jgi:hypothetical protein
MVASLATLVAWVSIAIAAPDSKQVDEIRLARGAIDVTINGGGVICGSGGKSIAPEAMPGSVLPARTHACLGIDFTTPKGRVSAVIPGDGPDYGGRLVAQRLGASSRPDRFVARHRIGDVVVRVEYWWVAATGALVSSVTLENHGLDLVGDVMVSWEWQIPGTAGLTWPEEFGAMLPPPPPDLHRLGLMPNNVLPGAEQGCGIAYVVRDEQDDAGLSPTAVDVPLRLWTGPNWPNGVDLGLHWGFTTGDFDQDGWNDVLVGATGLIFRNVEGKDWELYADTGPEIGDTEARYDAAIADYDLDGLPDFGTEPRAFKTYCFDLVKNVDGSTFTNVADDPGIIDVVPCNGDCETLAVADVDGDVDLDWFLPAYPAWVFGGPGNFFLQNLGPVGPGGAFAMHEASAEANLDNPDGVNRPEGAGFCDVDGDGDVDLYSNGTLYRNVSTLGVPRFEPLFGDGTEIPYGVQLDEGALFVDYDMDGDLDLLLSIVDPTVGLRMIENRGDGTFANTAKTVFDAFDQSLIFGVSACDWDNDGDYDVTSMALFRRNQWLETGTRHFTVATHNLKPQQLLYGVPAWFDADHDGDLDCAFGGWPDGWILENTLYDSTTPPEVKRHVRVRVVRDDATLDRGLETEFGAQVTLDVLGDAVDGNVRTQIVSASGGYLNQSDYVLQFALPADPDPDPTKDVRFAVRVDFKGASEQGYVRVDRHVNSLLGDVDLATLADREIVVYRSGRVKMRQLDGAPAVASEPLVTTTGGLALCGSTTPLPDPGAAPASDWFVGMEVALDPASPPQRVEELLLDGQLDGAIDCSGTPANVFAWDVTDPTAPQLVPNGALERATKARNDRSALAIDFSLEPGRVYRIVARVTKLRATAIAAPIANGPLTTTGGLSYPDASPCDGIAASAASVDPANVHLALRFRDEPAGAWADLGHAYSASGSPPTLTGMGELRSDTQTTVALSGAPPLSQCWLVVGASTAYQPYFDGVIVPAFDIILESATDALGTTSFTDCWPEALPGGTTFYFQSLILDDAAPHGMAFSNCIGAAASY